MVRCLSGRKERFAKPSYGLNCTEGSNPSLTAGRDKQANLVVPFFISPDYWPFDPSVKRIIDILLSTVRSGESYVCDA